MTNIRYCLGQYDHLLSPFTPSGFIDTVVTEDLNTGNHVVC